MDLTQWRTQVLAPLRQGRRPEADVAALGGIAIFAADTDRTQDYVFESARLPEIRGASRQLDDLNHHIADLVRARFGDQDEGADRGCVIYAGGGGMLALVPDQPEDLDTLRDAVEAAYPRETQVATVTADWRPVTVEMVLQGYPDEGFGGLVQWAGHWLRRRKEDKAPPPFFEALSHMVRCASCQTRPASVDASFPDRPLCSACRAKRDYLGRHAWFGSFQDFLDQPQRASLKRAYYSKVSPFPSLSDELNDERGYVPRQIPQDLSEIGQASLARRGYVGVIHLDGDGLGQILFRSPTAQGFADFSRAIAETMEQAVMRGLGSRLTAESVAPGETRRELGQRFRPGEKVPIHPFEILTIGGDDVWLIVPGDAALPLAASIAHDFAESGLYAPGQDRRCTVSGGVVIADDHTPVRALQEVAHDLARSAKAAREKAQADVGYIDFHIFKSVDMLDRELGALRNSYPYTLPDMGSGLGKSLRLLRRPYRADTLLDLWEGLVDLRRQRFSTSQMHLLAENLLLGRAESTLFYEYQRTRMAQAYRLLDAVLGIGQGTGAQDPIPWEKLGDKDYSYATALWDIVEMYDFVAADAGEED